MQRIFVGALAPLFATACNTPPQTSARLDGELGYAEFYLLCGVDERCVERDSVPTFAIGSTFEFEVELSNDFPYHEDGANVEIHAGNAQFVDGAEKRTVMAISRHSDRYLVDYAHVYLYNPNAFRLESPDDEPLAQDEAGVYLIPLGGSFEADIVALHDGTPLEGRLLYDYRSLRPTTLGVESTGGSRVRLVGSHSGTATFEVSGNGHTERFQFEVGAPTRTNPPPPDDSPWPPRTNPTPADTDTDTDATSETDGDTDADTDGTTGEAGTTGGMK